MLAVEAIETRLRREPGAVRRLVRACAAGEVATLLGRNGMGKTTTVRSIMGIVAAEGRQRHASTGSRSRGLPVLPRRAGRHRARARGAPDLPEPHRAREPRRHRGQSRRAGRSVDARARCSRSSRSSPQRQRQHGQPALGRRAADARDRPRADDQPAAPDPRRGDRGPRAADPRGDLPLDRAPQGGRPVDPAHRQGRQGADARSPTRTTCSRRAASSGRGTSAELAAAEDVQHRYLGV